MTREQETKNMCDAWKENSTRHTEKVKLPVPELTKELFEEIFEGDTYEEVTDAEISGQTRWHTSYNQVVRHKETNSFWEVSWLRGSTECQDEGPENFYIRQVFPVQKVVTVYK